MNDFGEVLTTARRARGYTQSELSDLAGVTQAALSRYENGLREPDDQTLDALAGALGVTTRFLQHAGRARGAMAIDAHMRRRATAPASAWKRLEARLNMIRMHTSLLSEEIGIHSENHIPTLDPIDVDPAEAARITRMHWKMPIGPVRSLTQWLESAGCLVIEEPFGTTRVDGMSQWVGDTPVMFINRDVPTDRKRLTLAHELGHLVLHGEIVGQDVEDEANAFAAEFLMPYEVIKPQLLNLRISQLPELKRYWGVSMAAIVERSFRAGHMTPAARTNLYKQFSSRGWRTSEPLSDQIPVERPRLADLIADSLLDRGLLPDEVAEIAGFSSSEENGIFQGRRPTLRAV